MFLEQVTISSHNITLCGNTSPQYDILNRMVAERIKSGVNLKIEESKHIVLKKGNAANKLVYTFFDPKYGMLKGQDIVIIKSNKMYSIQYYAQSQQYSYYLPTIQQMIDSFQILNSNGTIKTLPPNIGDHTSKLLEYTNNQYGLSMKYPADWSKEEIDTTPRNYDVDVVQFFSPSCPLEYKVEFSITIRGY